VSKIQESSGVSFSLSFLIQILTAIVLGVWGFSELSNRISFLETVTGKHEESITDIETTILESQDAPISSDYVQNTSIRFIEERISIHQAEIERLSEKVYALAQKYSQR
tara:strand:- start:12719 stop:13045 length:327 start_codon:yes stop_codon:yes gene_type:complete